MDTVSVKKRYLLRLDVFDENLNLVPADGWESYEFRCKWNARQKRRELWDNEDLVVGIWRIFDRKKEQK